MIFKRLIVVLCFLVAAGMVVTGVVEGHAGGIMQVASQDAGPFKLTVWTSPDPAVPGEVHVATAVASAESALPILDAEVFIQLVPQNDGIELLEGTATTEESVNQFLYETIFDVEEEGLYEVKVLVTGSDGGQGEVSFALEVEEAPSLVLGLVGIVVLAVITGAAVWFYLRSTQPQVVEEGV